MAKELTAKAFDYSALEKDTKSKLIWFAGQIGKQKVVHATSGLEMGKMLTEARELCGDKPFVEWVEAECGYSVSTAYRYMDAHREFGDFPTVGKIELGAMYVLSKNKGAKQKAIKLADKGIAVTQSMAKKLVKLCKPKPPSPPSEDEPPEPPQDAPEPDTPSEPDSEPDAPEEDFPEDETMEEVCQRETSAIESWARQIAKLMADAQKALEDSPTLDELNARTGWERKLKEALATLRGTKPVPCPLCDGDNRKCTCKGHGRVTKQQYKQMV